MAAKKKVEGNTIPHYRAALLCLLAGGWGMAAAPKEMMEEDVTEGLLLGLVSLSVFMAGLRLRENNVALWVPGGAVLAKAGQASCGAGMVEPCVMGTGVIAFWHTEQGIAHALGMLLTLELGSGFIRFLEGKLPKTTGREGPVEQTLRLMVVGSAPAPRAATGGRSRTPMRRAPMRAPRAMRIALLFVACLGLCRGEDKAVTTPAWLNDDGAAAGTPRERMASRFSALAKAYGLNTQEYVAPLTMTVVTISQRLKAVGDFGAVI